MSVRRRPWLAALLSLVVPGTGQLYCGRLARGLVLFALIQAVFGASLLVALLPRGETGFALLVGAPIASLLVLVFSIVDAFRLARRAPTDGSLHVCQRPSAYLLLLVVGLAASVGGDMYASTHIWHAYVIPTVGMEPTVRRGDRVLASLLRYRSGPIERGDIVVFAAPDGGGDYVKRVIGLPGERIEVRHGEILIDGIPLPLTADDPGVFRETTGTHTYVVAPATTRVRPVVVPEDCFFLVGDNRQASKDSRHFGAVPRALIHGSVDYRYWASDGLSRIGPLE